MLELLTSYTLMISPPDVEDGVARRAGPFDSNISRVAHYYKSER